MRLGGHFEFLDTIFLWYIFHILRDSFSGLKM